LTVQTNLFFRHTYVRHIKNEKKTNQTHQIQNKKVSYCKQNNRHLATSSTALYA